jgi:hypothetical protein
VEERARLRLTLNTQEACSAARHPHTYAMDAHPQTPEQLPYVYGLVIHKVPWPMSLYLLHEAQLLGLSQGYDCRAVKAAMWVLAKSGLVDVSTSSLGRPHTC